MTGLTTSEKGKYKKIKHSIQHGSLQEGRGGAWGQGTVPKPGLYYVVQGTTIRLKKQLKF